MTASTANALGRYGVTANAIAPGAVTRLTQTVPDEKRVGEGIDDSVSPDNIAPIVTYLAGTSSDWLSGRTIGAMGYEVKLWNNPEVVSTVASDGPWNLDDLTAKVEKDFRPLADGLHPSIFMGQLPS